MLRFLARILFVVSLLVIGGAVGITLDRTLHGGGGFGLHQILPAHLATGDPRANVVQELHRVLELDDAQRRQVDSTIERHQIVLEEGWDHVQTSVTAAMDSVHTHLQSILTPEQWDRFLEWAKQQPSGGVPE
jgi:hypothetical protein